MCIGTHSVGAVGQSSPREASLVLKGPLHGSPATSGDFAMISPRRMAGFSTQSRKDTAWQSRNQIPLSSASRRGAERAEVKICQKCAVLRNSTAEAQRTSSLLASWRPCGFALKKGREKSQVNNPDTGPIKVKSGAIRANQGKSGNDSATPFSHNPSLTLYRPRPKFAFLSAQPN